jgi:hypothetical protein
LACNFIHVCKKSTVFRAPVFTKLAEAQQHHVQTSHTQFSSKSGEKCENYERKLIYLNIKYGVHCAEFHDFIFSMPFQTGPGAPKASWAALPDGKAAAPSR